MHLLLEYGASKYCTVKNQTNKHQILFSFLFLNV